MERKDLFCRSENIPLAGTQNARKAKTGARSVRGLLQVFGDAVRQVTSLRETGRHVGRVQESAHSSRDGLTLENHSQGPREAAARNHATAADAHPLPQPCSICLEPMLPTDMCISLGCSSQQARSGVSASNALPSKKKTEPQRVGAAERVPHRLHTVCFRQYVTFSLQNCQVTARPSEGGGKGSGIAILRCPIPECREDVPQSVIRRLLLPSTQDLEVCCVDEADDDFFLVRRRSSKQSDSSSVSLPLSTSTLASGASSASRRRGVTRGADDGSATASPSPSHTPSSSSPSAASGALAAAAAAAMRQVRRGEAADAEAAQKENCPEVVPPSSEPPSSAAPASCAAEGDKEGRALYGVYLERTFEAYADTAGDVVRCLAPGCGYAFWWPADAEWLEDEAERQGGETCPKCQSRCLVCGCAVHEDVGCEEAWSAQNAAAARSASVALPGGKGGKPGSSRVVARRDLSFWRELRRVDSAFEEYKKAENLRDCVQCGATVHLEAGCHRMRCRCGYKFCYVCGTPNATCTCPEVQGHGFLTLEEVRQTHAPTRRRAASNAAAGESSRRPPHVQDASPAAASAAPPAPGRVEHVSRLRTRASAASSDATSGSNAAVATRASSPRVVRGSPAQLKREDREGGGPLEVAKPHNARTRQRRARPPSAASAAGRRGGNEVTEGPRTGERRGASAGRARVQVPQRAKTETKVRKRPRPGDTTEAKAVGRRRRS
ncbi:hypothetical protein BESB_060490 [Besnoitia besnoiti]|uniref:IBR domain-containing protein n=1 Tax=Besnoitia besnoiti TaxID=94643 RepID=A0A2A9MIE1_BESBE|nr:hypothetical protein BESB_060490 [Besnoitia besnoiti]PFH35162.1 hypothetical protein BESB_060490 [Besnoitia besnoiti]